MGRNETIFDRKIKQHIKLKAFPMLKMWECFGIEKEYPSYYWREASIVTGNYTIKNILSLSGRIVAWNVVEKT